MTESWMGLFLKLMAYTGAVIVLMLGVYWALRRQMMGQLPTQDLLKSGLKRLGVNVPTVAPSPLRVIARTALEPRKTLHVIAYEDGAINTRILVATTPEGVTLLSRLDASPASSDDTDQTDPAFTGAES
jgi:flagellar biogenesis protein FliO